MSLETKFQKATTHNHIQHMTRFLNPCFGKSLKIRINSCNAFFLRSAIDLFDITYLLGPGSSVGIATAYGRDGPGIDSRWGEIFRTCPDLP